MITSNVFNIAESNADALKDVIGKSVIPAGRSALSAIVSMTCVGSIPDTTEISYADVVTALTQDDTDGPSDHTTMIGAYIDKLVPLANAHIAFIQNHVAPKVTEYEEKLEAAIHSAQGINPVNDFNIIQVSSISVLQDTDFIGFLSRFRDPDIDIPGPLGYLPELTIDDIISKTAVNSEAINEQIKSWLVSKGDSWISDVWHYYFAANNTTPSGTFASSSFKDNFAGLQYLQAYDRQATSLLIFLLARGLYDEPLESAGVDLAKWRSDLDHVSRWAAYQAVAASALIKGNLESGTIVLSTTNNGKTIAVDSVNYEKYLSAGGQITDIIGAVLHNKSLNYSIQGMQESGDKYKQVWDNYMAVSKSYIDSKVATRIRTEAVEILNSLCKPCTDEEGSFMAQSTNSFETMQAKTRALVESMSLKQLLKTRELALEVVAGIRFAHTPAKQFLIDMLEAQEAGCERPQEAAAVAAIGYIADYLCTDLALVDE